MAVQWNVTSAEAKAETKTIESTSDIWEEWFKQLYQAHTNMHHMFCYAFQFYLKYKAMHNGQLTKHWALLVNMEKGGTFSAMSDALHEMTQNGTVKRYLEEPLDESRFLLVLEHKHMFLVFVKYHCPTNYILEHPMETQALDFLVKHKNTRTMCTQVLKDD